MSSASGGNPNQSDAEINRSTSASSVSSQRSDRSTDNRSRMIDTSDLYPISVSDPFSIEFQSPQQSTHFSTRERTIRGVENNVIRDEFSNPNSLLGPLPPLIVQPSPIHNSNEILSIQNLQNSSELNSYLTIPRVHDYPRKIIEGSRHLRDSSLQPSSRRRSCDSGNLLNNPDFRSRPSTGYGSRLGSAATCRPTSSVFGRPHSTGLRRVSSPRIGNYSTKLSPLDVIHLPPGGPDCLRGCGYSGLPCYVCSTKEKSTLSETPVEVHRYRRFFGLQIRPRRTSPIVTGGIRTERNSPIDAYESVKLCCEITKSKLRLPRSRTNQCILTVVLIYILLCIQFVITGFMAGSVQVSTNQ